MYTVYTCILYINPLTPRVRKVYIKNVCIAGYTSRKTIHQNRCVYSVYIVVYSFQKWVHKRNQLDATLDSLQQQMHTVPCARVCARGMSTCTYEVRVTGAQGANSMLAQARIFQNLIARFACARSAQKFMSKFAYPGAGPSKFAYPGASAREHMCLPLK